MATALSAQGEPAGGGKKVEAAEGDGGGGGEGAASHAPPAAAEDGGSVGLPHWERQRSAWVSGERAATASGAEEGAEAEERPRRNRTAAGPRPPVIDPDANYDDLLLTNEPFEVPVPLPEMVDFLVDTWIDDGLY